MQTDLLQLINKTTANAQPEWREEAEATMHLLIKLGDDFTSEEVIRILDEKGVRTHELRALGGLFQSFSKKGYIRFIRYTKATRNSRHSAPVALWRPLSRLANV